MAGDGTGPDKEGVPQSPHKCDGDQHRLFFREVLAGAPISMALIDGATLRVRWANAAFQRLTEIDGPKRDLAGTPLDELINHTEQPELLGIFRQAAETGTPFHQTEYEYRHQDGRLTYWNWSLLPCEHGAERQRELLLMAVDVTAPVGERNAVEKERHRLRTILDTLPVGVFILDQQGRTVEINDRARLIWGGRPRTAPPWRISASTGGGGRKAGQPSPRKIGPAPEPCGGRPPTTK